MRATSVESTSGRPSGDSATSRGSGRRNSTRRASCMSATIDGRSGPIAVRQRRAAVARRDLLGDGRAADHGPRFEHERLETGPRQVEGGDEAVVAGADDEGCGRTLTRRQEVEDRR